MNKLIVSLRTPATLLQALATLFVSVLAAVFAWQQVAVSKDHNRRSVRPVLQITPYLEGSGGRNGIYLSNDGLGPAVLKHFAVLAGGFAVERSELDQWATVLRANGSSAACFATAWPRSETTLKAGVDIPLLYVPRAEGNEKCMLEMLKLLTDRPLVFNLAYESIYADHSQLSTTSKVHSASIVELMHHYGTR